MLVLPVPTSPHFVVYIYIIIIIIVMNHMVTFLDLEVKAIIMRQRFRLSVSE